MAGDDIMIDLSAAPALRRSIEKAINDHWHCNAQALTLHKDQCVARCRRGFTVQVITFWIWFDLFTEEVSGSPHPITDSARPYRKGE
jgi:hypothetical protein